SQTTLAERMAELESLERQMAQQKRVVPERPKTIAADSEGLAWVAAKTFSAAGLRYQPGCFIETETLFSMPGAQVMIDNGFVRQCLASKVNHLIKPVQLKVTENENRPVVVVLAPPQPGGVIDQHELAIKNTMTLNGCTRQKAVDAIELDNNGGSQI